MAAPTKQVRLPFDQLTESGLKPTIKKMEKWGLKVSSVDAPNRARRESGFLLKDATFTFEDGQKMLVRVKADGTVFQVKLNNKVVPIKHVDDMDKAIVEMVDYVQANAKAYQRAKLQREKRRRLNIEPPAVVTNRQEKIERAKAQLTELTTANGELDAQAAEMQATVTAKQGELKKAESELAAERDKTTTLERTFAELSGQGA